MIATPLNAQNALGNRKQTSTTNEASILLKRSQQKLIARGAIFEDDPGSHDREKILIPV